MSSFTLLEGKYITVIHIRKQHRNPYETQNRSSDPTIPLLGMYPKEMKTTC